MDNIHDAPELTKELDGCKSAIDFREILIRNPSSWEEQERMKLLGSSDKHDVINLQFTRWFPSARDERPLTRFFLSVGPQDIRRQFRSRIAIYLTMHFQLVIVCA